MEKILDSVLPLLLAFVGSYAGAYVRLAVLAEKVERNAHDIETINRRCWKVLAARQEDII